MKTRTLITLFSMIFLPFCATAQTKTTDISQISKSRSQKACNNGDGVGCYNLGVMSYHGKKMPKDFEDARFYFRKACDKNMEEACFNLGIMYERGEGGSINNEKAKAYYAISCDVGNLKACGNLISLNNRTFSPTEFIKNCIADGYSREDCEDELFLIEEGY